MMTDHSQYTLKQMESMLRRCRRRIVMAATSVRLRDGLEFYQASLLVIAGLFLLFRVASYAVGTPAPLSWVHVLSLALIFGAVIFVRAIWLGVWGSPVHVIGAAERLDLSQSTHNRIATALALLRAGDVSPFAEAAICDGFERLKKLQAEQPYVETFVISWGRKGVWLTLILLMLLTGQLLEADPRSPENIEQAVLGSTPQESLAQEPVTAASDSPLDPEERGESQVDRQPEDNASARDEASDENDADPRAEPDSEVPSDGPSGEHASGESRSSQSSSNSLSAASGVGANSEPGESEQGNSAKPRDANKPTVEQPKVDQDNQQGGSINARGSSSSNSMRTSQNEWSSEVNADSSESDDFEQEEEPDEEMDPDKQRLGVQPTLKSRVSRLSRELSLGMGTGLSNDMMRGRGGANAPKKSRGTASMIMGVPVPDFVRGRLLPGPSKSTQEEVEPSPREGEYAVASLLQQADPEESPQQRYRPSAAMDLLARDYLINYHATNENEQNGEATNE